MKTSNLPPELVEKMISVQGGLKQPILAQQCAQIAVHYAEEKQIELLGMWSKEVDSLKHQRDELIEKLRQIEILCDGNNDSHEQIWHIAHGTIEIIKKHEDGKE